MEVHGFHARLVNRCLGYGNFMEGIDRPLLNTRRKTAPFNNAPDLAEPAVVMFSTASSVIVRVGVFVTRAVLMGVGVGVAVAVAMIVIMCVSVVMTMTMLVSVFVLMVMVVAMLMIARSMGVMPVPIETYTNVRRADTTPHNALRIQCIAANWQRGERLS
jgi:hypothetical protein